jgi:hypothetical protein
MDKRGASSDEVEPLQKVKGIPLIVIQPFKQMIVVALSHMRHSRILFQEDSSAVHVSESLEVSANHPSIGVTSVELDAALERVGREKIIIIKIADVVS